MREDCFLCKKGDWHHLGTGESSRRALYQWAAICYESSMRRFLLVFLLALPCLSFAEDGLFDSLVKPAEPEASAAAETEDGTDGGAADDEDEVFDENEFWENYDGPDIEVIYDERSEIDYVIVRTEDEYAEYHYLNHIGYSDLIFVLTDMLKRITEEGYIYASRIATEYKTNEEVALIYKINRTEDTAYGIVQFPDFSISVRAKKEASEDYPFNAASPNHMMALVYQFTMALAEVEQRLGVKQLEYTKKFFKQ
jgi:hypothetical protein